MARKVEKTEAQWRSELTPEQFRVTRQRGTERAFTGEYYATKTPGTYKCVCCGEPLFSSASKYDSGCGWPSFTRPAAPDVIEESVDQSHGMVRTEVTCQSCGAHLGHVFPDGPPAAGGLRYCINSAALDLDPKAETEG